MTLKRYSKYLGNGFTWHHTCCIPPSFIIGLGRIATSKKGHCPNIFARKCARPLEMMMLEKDILSISGSSKAINRMPPQQQGGFCKVRLLYVIKSLQSHFALSRHFMTKMAQILRNLSKFRAKLSLDAAKLRHDSQTILTHVTWTPESSKLCKKKLEMMKFASDVCNYYLSVI